MVRPEIKFLKAVLFPENILELPDSVIETSCYTVQDYKYHCYRERDEFGNTHGDIVSDCLTFTTILSSVKACKLFYQRMEEMESSAFSFLFNANFNTFGRLSNFEDGLIVHGYVVDIEEKSKDNDNIGSDEQLILQVTLQLTNLQFMGREKVHQLEITGD